MTSSTRLTFVTGKGGVGKTTVAAGLARSAAEHGRRVLAVDAVDAGDLDALLQPPRPDLAGTDDATGSITVLSLNTRNALDEYVKIYLKIPIAPSSLGPLARIFDFVSAAAPGVREILTVGKIGYEARYGSWDEIVVDAPATGHVVELLSAPQSLSALAATGPLANQTGWLREVLAATSTSVVVVSLPEELPIAETGQLITRIGTDTEVSLGAVVANRVPVEVGNSGRREAERLVADDHRLAPVAVAARDRDVQARPQVARLQSMATESGIPLVTVADRPHDPVGAVVDACLPDWA